MSESKGGPNKWAANHAATAEAAQAIIDSEANQRDEKTAKLKAQRLAREVVSEGIEKAAAKPKSKAGAVSKGARRAREKRPVRT
jgi:hypothetical protein